MSEAEEWQWGITADDGIVRPLPSEKSARRMEGNVYDQGVAVAMRRAIGPWEPAPPAAARPADPDRGEEQ